MIVYLWLGCAVLFIIWALIKIEHELYKSNPKKIYKIEKWIYDNFCK